MKKIVMISVIIICMLSFAACADNQKDILEDTATSGTEPESESGISDKIPSEHEAIANEYVQTLVNKEYEKLRQQFTYDAAIEEAFANDDLMTKIESTIEGLGTFETIKEFETAIQQGHSVFVYPCVFKSGGFKISIAINSDGEIASLNISPDASAVEAELPPDNVIETEVPLVIDESHQLPGILTCPEGEGEYPVVILVHGSGTTNKDEYVQGNTPFRDIAWGLAKQGIATYRYDKRNYVYPEMSDDNFTVYDETINDVISAYEMVKGLDGVNSKQIYILGHSLGGYLMPLIASEADADGYIIMAGCVSKLSDVIRYQLDFFASIDGEVTEEEEKSLSEQLTALEEQLDTPYWEFLEAYDTIAEAQTIEKPVLVLQGEEDYQVTMDEFKQWNDAFAGKSNWSLKSYEGLTHLFTTGLKENAGTDYVPAQRMNQQVIDDIASFIVENK